MIDSHLITYDMISSEPQALKLEVPSHTVKVDCAGAAVGEALPGLLSSCGLLVLMAGILHDRP